MFVAQVKIIPQLLSYEVSPFQLILGAMQSVITKMKLEW